jgi:hypothetical protein
VWAVIVGVNDYPGTDHDLRQAVADADDVDAALQAYGVPSSHRLVLRDGQASAADIRRSLGWLVDHAAADATAVVFFAGHVRHVTSARGGPTHVALVGADGADVDDGEMSRVFAHLDARSAWIAIAACYSAEFESVLAPGWLLTAAAGRNELAYENSALGHSYLVEYMVHQAMIGGQAPNSVQDAFRWAHNRIARDYPNRLPVMIDRSFVPIGLRPPAPPASQAPSPRPHHETSPPPPQPASPEPGPQPAEPTPPPPTPGCAHVLGLGLCRPTARVGLD